MDDRYQELTKKLEELNHLSGYLPYKRREQDALVTA